MKHSETMATVREALYWMLFSRIPDPLGTHARERYFRGVLKECGVGVTFGESVRIICPLNVALKNRVGVARDVVIDGRSGVEIGDDSLIGFEAVILSATHNFSDLNTPIRDQGMWGDRVSIESDVWIGARAFVLPGVRIGEGSVIGTSAVVTHDIPPFSIAGGVPARVIGTRKPS